MIAYGMRKLIIRTRRYRRTSAYKLSEEITAGRLTKKAGSIKYSWRPGTVSYKRRKYIYKMYAKKV
jgi:hypothetical protein